MLYNTDTNLWKSHFESRVTAKLPQRYDVQNGMVSNGLKVIARFASQADALETLKAAGWLIKGEKCATHESLLAY